MTRLIHAPWTPEQVDALNRFQQMGGMHPFTCGGDHTPGSPVLVAREDGWHCPQPYGEHCDYRQDWAPAFMVERGATLSAVVAPPTDQAAAIASCPGYEASPNPCRCPCYGCKHHCGAHTPEGVPESTGQAALLDRIAEAALAAVETALGDTLAADAREEALAGIAAVLPATDQAAVLAETLIERCPDHGCVEPAWEDGCHCEIVPLLRRPADEQPGARHVHITIHHPDPTTATTAAQAITTDAPDTGAAPHRPAGEAPDTTTARGCPSDCSCRAVCIGTLKPAAGARQDGGAQ